ncbi:sugar O-acetyltransferase [Macrococcus hajekii]|uniref:Sugar O-acetyltransferase n=1 Tax=Macrococcus hajekii TaxID=198482 RepID=A0A4R6BJA3_9STAP|nr:DapH/DapD/GlmU-related protein [Macrococcus hajekii]TDM01783.1 sugar O-acetyltransferase [Macrococcus hajekii]GGB07417.1 acetyltransferase [Macrococcus hajekii]
MKLVDKIQGIEILKDDAVYDEIHEHKGDNEQLSFELNTTFRTNEEVLKVLEKMTGQTIDSSVVVSLPFYTDYGRHMKFGRDIFINKNVTFVDLGGIEIEDQVLIGPSARLITVNHLTDPAKRRGLIVKKIVVKKNAWIGANVTVLPGVIIGENAIVAADSTVTKDVLANTIVAGTPAKVIKKVDQKTIRFS